MESNINYYLLNLGSGYAVIADGGNRLFLKETVEPASIYSSYEPVSAGELRACAAISHTIVP